jgi:hypothetical protein
MSDHKFYVGDVVRIIGDESGSHNGELAEVIAVVRVDWYFDELLEIRTSSGLCARVPKELVQPVTLEEVQEHYADKPRRGFIVDGLTVDELESGQDEAYRTFRAAAIEANREEEQRAAEEARKERRVLAELTVTSIMWVVFTFVSLAMWLVVMWTGETAFAPIGYYSALVSVVAVVKPMYALILVCREQIKERQRGRRHNIK